MEKRKAALEVFLEQQKSMNEDLDVSENLNLNEESDDEYIPSDDFLSSTPSPGVPYNTPKPQYQQQERKSMRDQAISSLSIKSSEEMQLEKDPVQVKINGFWIWKRVIVPPNAYVVHTRLNKKDPVTLGLGISFRYNPYKDAYIVIPAAMQTIGVVANCISKEKQGINVLAYVQWQIHDFSVAYKKLDLTNSRDPLGIVNAQLREQAEAAIKDKIATMSVEEVLTDKAPIIEELTSRLSRVAEGQEGLGIKIITVQIREALISSSSLWNDLQSPFRNEQKKKSKISQLEMENEINKKELETLKSKELRSTETNFEIEKSKQLKYTETVKLQYLQETSRYEEEQKKIQTQKTFEEETFRFSQEIEDKMLTQSREFKLKQDLEELKLQEKKLEEEQLLQLEAGKRALRLETERIAFEVEQLNLSQTKEKEFEISKLDREKILLEKKSELEIYQKNMESQITLMQLEASNKQKELEILIQKKEQDLQIRYEESQIAIQKLQQEVDNLISSNRIVLELIKNLPEIASNMPKPQELKIFQTDRAEPFVDSLSVFIEKMTSVLGILGEKPSKTVE